MEREIIQGTTPGQRRRGRPKTSWHDNIMEWTGLKGHCLLRSGEDRRQIKSNQIYLTTQKQNKETYENEKNTA